MKDIVRRTRSSSTTQNQVDTPRKSIFSSVKLSSLLQRQDSEEPPTHSKPVILALKLSSRLFLDAAIREDTSSALIYQVKTEETLTTLTRVIQRDDPVKVGSVKWPKTLPTKAKGKEFSDGVYIQMKEEQWYGGETMLKPSSNSSSRRFYIPNYSQPLKWKQYGSVYWCTTAAVKGPVAILEPCKDISPTKLIIFETLHDKYDNRSLTAYNGVSLLLLDYLLVTGMLLITDLQDWMILSKPEDQPRPRTAQMSLAESTSSMPELNSTSTDQWRKMMYGEPLFPKKSSETRSRISGISSSTTPSTPAFPNTPPSFGSKLPSVSSEHEPMSLKSTPVNRARHATSTIAGSLSDRDDAFSFNEPRSRSPMLNYRPSTSASRIRVDSSNFSSLDEPPVPPLPSQFAGPSNQSAFASQPPTPVLQTFTRSSHHSTSPPESLLVPRRRSSPLVDFSENTSPSESQDSHSVARAPRNRISRSDSINSTVSTASRPGTSRRRPLPQPPPMPPLESSSSHSVRRIQSSHQLSVKAALPKDLTSPPRPQRSLPPTPNTVMEHHITGPSHLHMYVNAEVPIPRPPVVKTTPDDPILRWADSLNNPERDSPTASVPPALFDVPPPAYNSINFSKKPDEHGPSVNPDLGNPPP